AADVDRDGSAVGQRRGVIVGNRDGEIEYGVLGDRHLGIIGNREQATCGVDGGGIVGIAARDGVGQGLAGNRIAGDDPAKGRAVGAAFGGGECLIVDDRCLVGRVGVDGDDQGRGGSGVRLVGGDHGDGG